MARRRMRTNPDTGAEEELEAHAEAVPVGTAPVAPPAGSNVPPPVDGGRYLVDAKVDPSTGAHYGGRVVNAHGETIEEFEPHQQSGGPTPPDED